MREGENTPSKEIVTYFIRLWRNFRNENDQERIEKKRDDAILHPVRIVLLLLFFVFLYSLSIFVIN